jgi:NAD(P)-dependent dehydrogenase (short-subunit alcohol dehydrogenase family)
VRAVRLDVTDQQTIAALRRETGALDVVVNNAAIHYDTFETVTSVDFKVVHEAMETNVYGAWRMTLALLPLLRQGEHARVVNVSSEAGAFSSLGPGTPAYSLSKAPLNALTVMLAADLRRSGILVNAVCPGWVATDMGGPGGRPVAEGAASVLWAVDLPDNAASGHFYRDGRRLEF